MRVVVLDLDGVIRHFDSLEIDAVIEAELGLPERTLWRLVMESPDLDRAATGGPNRREWEDRIEAELRSLAMTGADVGRSFQRWRANIGKADPGMVELIEQWHSRDIPVFIFTNGTDRVPAELEQLGVAELFHGVLNSYDYGVRKPAAEAYRMAHAEIEAVLGRAVRPHEVYFTDDKAKNVQAARSYGWRAEVFESAAAIREI